MALNGAQDFPQARERMIQEEVVAKGIADPRVIEAMRTVPRHRFVAPAMERSAYGPSALPIGLGQTISAPNMVALMTEALALTGSERVLEIGTGSGYQAAVLGRLTRSVVTLERIPELARRAQKLLAELGLTGVIVKVGDGTLGYREMAPYDRILVTAGGPRIPEALLEQLADGGVLVMPVGAREVQTLTRVTRAGDAYREESLCRCVFVPLVGRQGHGENGS